MAGRRPRVILQKSRPSATLTGMLLEYVIQGSRALQRTRRLSLHVQWCHHVHLTVSML
jgi:hypothetical protein